MTRKVGVALTAFVQARNMDTSTVISFSLIGNLKNWWSPETSEEFKARAQCIVEQYGNFTEGGTNLNGVNTQGESIADNGGVRATFRAYGSTTYSSQGIFVNRRIGLSTLQFAKTSGRRTLDFPVSARSLRASSSGSSSVSRGAPSIPRRS